MVQVTVSSLFLPKKKSESYFVSFAFWKELCCRWFLLSFVLGEKGGVSSGFAVSCVWPCSVGLCLCREGQVSFLPDRALGGAGNKSEGRGASTKACSPDGLYEQLIFYKVILCTLN